MIFGDPHNQTSRRSTCTRHRFYCTQNEPKLPAIKTTEMISFMHLRARTAFLGCCATPPVLSLPSGRCIDRPGVQFLTTMQRAHLTDLLPRKQSITVTNNLDQCVLLQKLSGNTLSAESILALIQQSCRAHRHRRKQCYCVLFVNDAGEVVASRETHIARGVLINVPETSFGRKVSKWQHPGNP